MAVLSVLIALQACGENSGAVRSAFVMPLGVQANEPIEHIGRCTVQFPIVRLSECRDAEEPHELLAARIKGVLKTAAEFLDRRPADVFDSVVAAGLSVRVFIDIRMNQDQFEIDLTAEFVRACGRHGLGIFVMSNDISAEEAIRAGAT